MGFVFRVSRCVLFSLAVAAPTRARADGPRVVTARYTGADFRAGGFGNEAEYNYLGGDIFVGIRLLRWVGVEAFYGFDVGQGAYGYPNACGGICCGAVDRSWRSEQIGARALFVPLHTRFVDVALGIAMSAVLARVVDTVNGGVNTSLGCTERPGTREVEALVATISLVVDVRPLRWLGLRLAGEAGIATTEIDWPVFHFVVGPVIWF